MISHLDNTIVKKTGPRDFPDIELLFKSESESEI